MPKFQRSTNSSIFSVFKTILIHLCRAATVIGVIYLIGIIIADGVRDRLLNQPVLMRFLTGSFVVLLTYALYLLLRVSIENLHNKERTIHNMPLTVPAIRDLCMDTPWDFCFAMNYYFAYPRLPLFSFAPNYYPACVHSAKCWSQALNLFHRLFDRMPAGFDENAPFDWAAWAKNEIRGKLKMPQDAEIPPSLLREVLSHEMLHKTGIIIRDSVDEKGVMP